MNKKASARKVFTTSIIIILFLALIFLFVFTKDLRYVTPSAMKMTDKELVKEINKIYGDDFNLSIYPPSRMINSKQGQDSEVAIVIKNLLSDKSEFKYSIAVKEFGDKCSLNNEDAMRFILLGVEGSRTLGVGDSFIGRVRFAIPKDAPFCIIRYEVNVTANGEFYASDDFDVKIITK